MDEWSLDQRDAVTVKKERAVFKALRPSSSGVISLDLPSPQKRLRSSAVPNPDDLPGLPPAGEAPDEDVYENTGGTYYQDACLFVSLQNLGVPISCMSNGPFSVSFGNSLLKPLGVQLCHMKDLHCLPDGKYIVHDAQKQHFFALHACEGSFRQMDGSTHSWLSLQTVHTLLTDTNFTLYQFRPLSLRALTSFTFGDDVSQKDCVGGAGVLSKSFYATHLKACQCGHR